MPRLTPGVASRPIMMRFTRRCAPRERGGDPGDAGRLPAIDSLVIRLLLAVRGGCYIDRLRTVNGYDEWRRKKVTGGRRQRQERHRERSDSGFPGRADREGSSGGRERLQGGGLDSGSVLRAPRLPAGRGLPDARLTVLGR